MCNRARRAGEPESLFTQFGVDWLVERPRDNRFNPEELYPGNRAYVIRREGPVNGLDVMSWDVLAGQARSRMTNVRQLHLPQWRRLVENPANRCLVPLTQFCEWTPKTDPELGIKGEMWFSVADQPLFAVAGLWQQLGDQRGFAMVTCPPNELVRPIHPKAMITILEQDDQERWLTGDTDEAIALQRPYPADRMTVEGPVFPTRKSKPEQPRLTL